ncbi:3-(cis-5,6-dihydroxycyclohexa-1,3-dien-1-yl)propanoate dehydrogenase [Mycolicibacterium holsaticum]|uniref:3-(Cis-5,6-dihydroxycyclohexa-1, 3-dien-1-yl)propanoate dehydrogenase n=1 Tax=Mycolicibacterium holsaticum TaxID=152142 RepID=A0A1E3R4M8_9MYCO|nr:3-(cis-5,6-dihydroxycyclohexa-1,3-dien-1-yl)propanoate dehydrogenase [Mycolicibacterium holsaticum]ODQ84839.1 3-(cis-5,6-dihydroxycyclohexa-1,3-dien-1-yl)propanoate dehydrogenase [Mycolicibacterium holsaticum]
MTQAAEQASSVGSGWLDGKVALVVGGGSGIGRGVADRFVAEGARVAVLDYSKDAIEALNDRKEPSLMPILADARSLNQSTRAVARVIDAYGSIDTLVVCAGITDHFTSLEDLPVDSFDDAFKEIFDINVKASLTVTKAALPALRKSEGTIVYTISNAGFLPGGGGPLYTASKFAVRGLVTQLSYELAPAIRVNAVAPGGTVTALRGAEALGLGERRLAEVPNIAEMIRAVNPLRVVPQPSDHAWAYLFLASKSRIAAITGCVVRSDGGLDSRGLIPLDDGIGSRDM